MGAELVVVSLNPFIENSIKLVLLGGGHLIIMSIYLHRFGSSRDENSIRFVFSKAPYKNHLQNSEEGPSGTHGFCAGRGPASHSSRKRF